MSHRTNRRQFLQTSAAASIGFWVAGGVRAQESKSPNERIAMASIGLYNKGDSDSKDAGNNGDMVAICDVDENYLNRGRRTFPKAKAFTDFRQMLDEMGKSIDAVTVSTPDHTHAAAALMAMRMGKHCYCQKPLTHSIYEARLMAEVARQQKVATQMGNQGTAESTLRRAAAAIKSGVLGPVKEVHVWTNRPVWPQGIPRPEPAECGPPGFLNWDLWLGPAAPRPYAKGYHPFNWRGWWDFGTGALGDMACHTVNMPFMALNLRDPEAVQAVTSGHNQDSYPNQSTIAFDFPARDERPALKLYWYDGGNRPNAPVYEEMKELFKEEIEQTRQRNPDDDYLESGCIVVGEKSTLFSPGDYAQKKQKLSGGEPLPEVEFTASPGHFEEWIRAIKGGEPAVSNFPDYAGALTETILLGNLAVWVATDGEGPKVEWDAKNLCCRNIQGLEPIIKPTYRPGYTLDV